jgi:hypothetical protein
VRAKEKNKFKSVVGIRGQARIKKNKIETMHGVSGRKRMYDSTDDEHEEQDQRGGSASGGKSKTLRRTVAPQSSLGANCFAAALETIPADDWGRTWAADRTMMLRMTSKRVKVAVDKLCPPAIVVLLSQQELLDKYQIYNARPAFAAKYILKQLQKMTSRCRITILDLEVAQVGDKRARRLKIADPSMLKGAKNNLPTPAGHTSEWVLECCRMRTTVWPSGVFEWKGWDLLPHPGHGIRPVEAVHTFVITITGYTGQHREILKTLIEKSGAQFTPRLTRANTHLLCNTPTTKKAIAANKWNRHINKHMQHGCGGSFDGLKIVKVVNHLWIMDSILSWTWQPCDIYTRPGEDIKADGLSKDDEDEADDEEWGDD